MMAVLRAKRGDLSKESEKVIDQKRGITSREKVLSLLTEKIRDLGQLSTTKKMSQNPWGKGMPNRLRRDVAFTSGKGCELRRLKEPKKEGSTDSGGKKQLKGIKRGDSSSRMVRKLKEAQSSRGIEKKEGEKRLKELTLESLEAVQGEE